MAPSGISSTTLRAIERVQFLRRRDRKLLERRVVLDDRRDFRHVDAGPVRAPPACAVDLDDDAGGAPGQDAGVVAVGAEAEIALLVHRRDRRHEGVDGAVLGDAAIELEEEVRDEVDDLPSSFGPGASGQLALRGAEEQTVGLEAAKVLETENGVPKCRPETE